MKTFYVFLLFLSIVIQLAHSRSLRESLTQKILSNFGITDCLYITDGRNYFENGHGLPPERAARTVRIDQQQTSSSDEESAFQEMYSSAHESNCFIQMRSIEGKAGFISSQNSLLAIKSEQRMSIIFLPNPSLLEQLPLCDYLAFETVFAVPGSLKIGNVLRLLWLMSPRWKHSSHAISEAKYFELDQLSVG